MTWPTPQVKTNVDAAGDDPKQARPDFAANVDKFNQMQAHVSSYIQGLLDDADAAAARATLGAQSTVGVSGDILYASGTNAWSRLAKDTNGQVLTLASGIPSWKDPTGAFLLQKLSDESVTNSTFLQGDAFLSFVMDNNSVYYLRYVLLLNATSSTPGFKFTIKGPTNMTALWGFAVEGRWGLQSPSALIVEDADGVTGSINGTTGLIIQAIIRNPTNVGSAKLWWAMDSAHASTIKVLQDSFLIAHRIGDD